MGNRPQLDFLSTGLFSEGEHLKGKVPCVFFSERSKEYKICLWLCSAVI